MTLPVNKIILGDCLEVMRGWPDESVQCCVTSPPYWGLRDYGTARWIGGEPGCDHKNGSLASPKSTLVGYTGDHVKLAVCGMPFKDKCGKCGAVRVDGQLGLEKTPEEYVAKMTEVFHEVRRVLKSTGTLWLNMGDSYYSTGQGGGTGPTSAYRGKAYVSDGVRHNRKLTPGVKPKDLVGIPWLVAFAFRADGWYLRSDIIWSKPNPMPESVQDRPTKAHEYIFLMTKSAKYYYDAKAIAEDAIMAPGRSGFGGPKNNDGVKAHTNHFGKAWDKTDTRNKRSVWSIATQPFPDAHFATFPTDLVKVCLMAGSRVGDVILDPFMGSGTVAVVAKNAGRNYVGIELNPAYITMAEKRLAQEVLQL